MITHDLVLILVGNKLNFSSESLQGGINENYKENTCGINLMFIDYGNSTCIGISTAKQS